MDIKTPSEIAEISTLFKVLSVMGWDMNSSQIKSAIAGLQGVDVDQLIAASDLSRTLASVGLHEKIVELRYINADLKLSSIDYREEIHLLKCENLTLKEENSRLKEAIKNAKSESIQDSIAKLNDLKNSL